MLARGNSDAAIRLRRAKSTPSVARYQHPLARMDPDPRSTFANAKAAATRAFGVVPVESHCERIQATACQPTSRRQCKSEGSHLARQRSKGERPRQRTTEQPKTIANRTPMRKSDCGTPRTVATHSERSSIVNFNLCGDFHLPGPRQNSARDFSAPEFPPRKLAGEIFCPGRNSDVMSTVPSDKKVVLDEKTAKGSMPMMTGTSVSTEKNRGLATKTTARKPTLDKARDRFLRQHQERSRIQVHSLADSSVPTSPTPETVRSKQSNTSRRLDRDDMQSQADSELRTDQRSLRQKVQTVPHSLRRICSRRFRRSSSAQSQVPVQHLEARKSHHFGSDNTTEPSSVDQVDFAWKETSECSALPPTPPPHQYPLSTISRPRTRGSFKSVGNPDDLACSGSRITSWTDSSSHRTLKDSLPLSPVKENEPVRKPSSSSHFTDITSSTIDRLHMPLKKISIKTSQKQNLNTQRVYSALMRKIARSRHSADEGSFGNEPEPDCEGSAAEAFRKASNSSVPGTPEGTVRIINDVEDSATSPEQDRTVLISDTLRIPMDARASVLSPSIYSLHFNGSTPDPNASASSLPCRPVSPTGTATIPAMQQPTIRWDLTAPGSNSEEQHKPNTSNEWRNWASDRVSSFDRKTSLHLMEFQRHSSGEGSSSHRREFAEIDGSHTDVGAGGPSRPHRPLSIFSDRSRMSSKSMSSVTNGLRTVDENRKRSDGSMSETRSFSWSTAARSPIPEGRCSPAETTDRSAVETRQVADNIIAGLSKSRNTPLASSASAAPLNARNTSVSNALAYAKRKIAKEECDALSSTYTIDSENRSPRAPRLSPSAITPRMPHRRPRLAVSASAYSLGQHVQAPASSPINDQFLKGIRKGPYGVASPSPPQRKRMTVRSPWSQGIREGGLAESRAATAGENTPPAKGGAGRTSSKTPTMSAGSRKMVDEFLSSRAGARTPGGASGEGSSPAFL